MPITFIQAKANRPKRNQNQSNNRTWSFSFFYRTEQISENPNTNQD